MDNQKQAEAAAENLEANSVPAEIMTDEEKIDLDEFNTQESETIGENLFAETAPPEEEFTLEDKVAEQQGIIATLNREIVSLREQLESQQQEYEATKNQSMRIAADFENFRRRTQKEKQDLEQQVKGNTIRELLPVIDNFERARGQIKPNTDGEMAIHKSYQGVYKQLVDSLKKLGVSAMRAEEQPFDPKYHEAMLKEPTDQYPEDTVIEQIVRGYLLGDQVLRHAMVKVAGSLESDASQESVQSEETGEDSSAEN